MSGKGIQFFYSLYDKITGPAARIQNALNGIDKAQTRAHKGMTKLQGIMRAGWNAISAGANGVKNALSSVFNLQNALVVGAGGLLTKQVIDAMAFKESTLESLNIMLGSRKAAADVFREAERFGSRTPFETRTVVDAYTRLLGAGFKRNQLKTAFSGIGDLTAFKNFDLGVMDRVITAMSQIKSKGHLASEELNQQLGELIPITTVYAKLTKLLGVNRTQVQKLIQAGKISSDTGILAIFQAVQEYVDRGKPLGTLLDGQSKSIKGMFSTLQSVPNDWFGKLVPDDLSKFDKKQFPAFVHLKRLLSNLVDAFDPSGGIGKKVQERARRMLNTVFGAAFQGAAAATDPKFILKLFDTAELKLNQFVKWMKSTWPQITSDFKTGLGDISLIVKTIADGIRTIQSFKSPFMSQSEAQKQMQDQMQNSTPFMGIPWLRMPIPNQGTAGGNGMTKPGGPMTPISFTPGNLGARGNRGNIIAAKAVEGLEAGWAESATDSCSKWVRQVFAKSFGSKTGNVFGSSATQTEQLWKRAGLTRSLAQVGGPKGLRPGDVLFQKKNHVGIYVGNGLVAENTTRYGKNVRDARALTPLSKFGRISSVGRADGFSPAAPPPVRPSAAPRTSSGGTKAPPTVNISFVQKPGENDHQAAERLARMAVDRMLAQLEQHAFEDGEYL
jgi:tape measure domain-containing protein